MSKPTVRLRSHFLFHRRVGSRAYNYASAAAVGPPNAQRLLELTAHDGVLLAVLLDHRVLVVVLDVRLGLLHVDFAYFLVGLQHLFALRSVHVALHPAQLFA